ncbi:hypothetical protein D3C87_1419560 [compost metagenome]
MAGVGDLIGLPDIAVQQHVHIAATQHAQRLLQAGMGQCAVLVQGRRLGNGGLAQKQNRNASAFAGFATAQRQRQHLLNGNVELPAERHEVVSARFR